jgi:hypothetical protein
MHEMLCARHELGLTGTEYIAYCPWQPQPRQETSKQTPSKGGHTSCPQVHVEEEATR